MVEFQTQILIVLIDKMNDLGRTPLSTNDPSEQRLVPKDVYEAFVPGFGFLL